MKRLQRWIVWLVLLSGLNIMCGGCKSPESENVSSRPWNSPRGYDSGLPGMYRPNR